MTETQTIWAVWAAGIPILGVLSAVVMGRLGRPEDDAIPIGMVILFWPILLPPMLASAIALGVIWAAGRAWLWLYEKAKR